MTNTTTHPAHPVTSGLAAVVKAAAERRLLSTEDQAHVDYVRSESKGW